MSKKNNPPKQGERVKLNVPVNRKPPPPPPKPTSQGSKKD